MVDYGFLEQFVFFSRCGTLSEVAERFHISQPTITRNMQRVEEAFGVPLFTRTKNRIALNENGRLAAEEAERVLRQTRDMLDRVRAFDKARRTISIGSCVVIPIPQLNREINSLFPKVTISTEVNSLDALVHGLEEGAYQLILLPYEPDSPDLISQKIEEEHLMFSLPHNHPFSGRSSLSMADMNGQNLLLFQEVGFWREIVDRKMPDSKFLIQNERYSLVELLENSTMPAFSSNLTLQHRGVKDRVNIPISDPEAGAAYYLVCRNDDRAKFAELFARLSAY